MEEELFPDGGRSDLLNLPNHPAYMRMLLDGEPSRPFSIRTTLPFVEGDEARALEVRASSREKYGRPRSLVEKEIAASLASPEIQRKRSW
jgi:hypothetical protein